MKNCLSGLVNTTGFSGLSKRKLKRDKKKKVAAALVVPVMTTII